MSTTEDILAVLSSVRLRGVQRDLSKATLHPVLGHALDQMTEEGAATGFQRIIAEPFAVARRSNPAITLREFLLDDPEAAALAKHLLGDDQYELATRVGGRRYFEARGRILSALRDADAAARQWLSWGHWGSGTPIVELFEGMPRILPVDHPVLRVGADGLITAHYPTWSTGRKRLFQNLAVVELSRRLPPGTHIPTDVLGAELLSVVSISRDVGSAAFHGEARLRMSTTQVVQTMSTGRSPTLLSLVVRDGVPLPTGARISSGIGGRAADDARWELFRRTGDAGFVDLATFEDTLAKHGGLVRDGQLPVEVNPEHAVTTLSPADLVAVARDSHGCARIASVAVEVEHRRAQRAVRTIERMLYALDQVVDTSLVRHLCGLCDPQNLRIVTPVEHGELDIMARYLGSGQRRVENSARSAGVRARHAGPDDTVDLVPADPLYEAPDDLVPPDRFDTDYDAHADVARGANVFFGFSPYQLTPVARLFQPIDVARVLAAYEAERGVQVTETWNFFAGCVNAAINHYEMDRDLLLRVIVRGRPL